MTQSGQMLKLFIKKRRANAIKMNYRGLQDQTYVRVAEGMRQSFIPIAAYFKGLERNRRKWRAVFRHAAGALRRAADRRSITQVL